MNFYNNLFFFFRARAWSHSTKDRFHDEWGFMTVDPNGNVTLMTTGNNGIFFLKINLLNFIFF